MENRPTCLPQTPAVRPVVHVDGVGVHRIGRGIDEHAIWTDLVEVGIMTTDEGPWVEDCFWLLRNQDGTGCLVPNADASTILPHLQRLPGFDNETVIRAATSTSNATFCVWKGAPGDGLAAAPG